MVKDKKTSTDKSHFSDSDRTVAYVYSKLLKIASVLLQLTKSLVLLLEAFQIKIFRVVSFPVGK